MTASRVASAKRAKERTQIQRDRQRLRAARRIVEDVLWSIEHDAETAAKITTAEWADVFRYLQEELG